MWSSPRLLPALALLLGLCNAAVCLADTADEALAARIASQLDDPGRDPYDVAKDPGRKPLQTMRFAGVEAGMTVLDVITGAGYNAEILAAAGGPTGTVYAQNSHFVLTLLNGARHAAMLARLEGGRLPQVRYLVVDTEDMPFDASIDLAFWGLNFHDIYNSGGEQAVLPLLAAVKRALKPGGLFVLSDHVGIAGQDNATLHRIEPRLMLEVLAKAGFAVEATSDVLGNAADDHTLNVTDDAIRYHTDQILVRARKLD
jgi:predicted methyltransferase